MPLAVVVSLLLALLVYQPCILLTPRLPMLLVVAVPLLVCQSGMGLWVLLAVPLLLLGCGGHVVQIVPLAVSSKNRL
jgi:hypothetical protein